MTAATQDRPTQDRPTDDRPTPDLGPVRTAARALVQGVSALGIGLLVLVAAATVLQVILRAGFGQRIAGMEEVLSLLTGVALAACLPAGFAEGQQLRVDGVVARLRPAARERILWLGDVLMLAFLAILALMVWSTAQTFLGRGQVTAIMRAPVGPFYLLMALGFLAALPFGLARITMLRAARGRSLPGLLAMLGAAAALVALAQATGLTGWLAGGSGTGIALRVFVLLWVLMLLGVPLSATMGLCGLTGLALMLSWRPAASVVGSEAASFLTSQSLAVLPLFLLMGALATVAGLSSDIYRFAHAALSPLRAGLCHATIVASAGFGALTGSSLATAATFGRIALPEMQSRGYAPGFAAGSVAAGGTLGSLVPPSMAMILYALLSEQSIGRLFIAALVPALLAVVLYMLVIALAVWLRPSLAPPGSPIDLTELRASARGCLGAALLFGTVIGGIYTGVFTDSEAASFGTIGAFLFALFRGKLKPATLRSVMVETATTISIIYMLIFGALTFSFFLAFSGVPGAFVGWVQGWGLSAGGIVLMLVLSYLVLGAVMDSYAMMVITIPIFAPLILALGFDPLWWGVITVVCVELGMITPPFGLNLFVIKSIAPRLSLQEIWRGILPFVAVDLVKLAILLAVPGLLLI